MKSVKEIEQNRGAYHADALLNTIHRSSLLATEFEHCDTELSFLNHFLIKRDIKEVALRITGIDADGDRIRSQSFSISEKRAYTLNLTKLFNKKANTYEVEFFSTENLFIPFPAVTINHVMAGQISQVHSYNRVLNDIFEEDSITKVHVMEAGLDYINIKDKQTFFVYQAGMRPVEGIMTCHLELDGQTYKNNIPISMGRYDHQLYRVNDIFPNVTDGVGTGFFRVSQPKQDLFYGRLMCGQMLDDGSFSGDHTFYDCSVFEEYWENEKSAYMVYPYIQHLTKYLRIYPIMSPGRYRFFLTPVSHSGHVFARCAVGEVESPSTKLLNINLFDHLIANEVDPSDVSSLHLEVLASEKERLPTRISAQIIHGSRNGLDSSFGKQLISSEALKGPQTRKMRWGQAIIGGGYNSFVSAILEYEGVKNGVVEVNFYSDKGLIHKRCLSLKELGGENINVLSELESASPNFREIDLSKHNYLWYVFRSKTHAIQAFNITTNGIHCSGDHSF